MAEAAELIFTKAGLDKAINAKISGIKISINRILVSDYLITSSDVPDIPNWSQLKGNIVFDTNDYIDTDNNLLRAHKVKSQTTDGSCVIITLYLGRSYGDFSCGSLGCYLDDGTLFAVLKLPEVHEKRKKSPAYPGDSVKFPIAITITDGDVIDISIIESYTATIPEVPSYNDLPSPDSSEYSMYIVYNYTGDGTPAIAARIETSDGSYWTFTLLAKNGWSNDFIQEDPSKLPYDDKTILAYDGETETWSKATGNIINDEVNPYVGVAMQDLSKETIDYNTQVNNKPKIRNSLNQEITIQNTIDTAVFNLVDKTDIETQDINSREDDKVFSTACVNTIKTNIQQLIDLNSIKKLDAVSPLRFNSETNQLSILIDASINNYSSNPVQNQVLYREFAKYPKNDELAKVAFSGSYEDLINTPEEKGNVVKYVEDLPDNPENFLYENSAELFTFIGAYDLTYDSHVEGYLVTEEGLLQNGVVICSFKDLPNNWDSGGNYSQLFQSVEGKTGDVVIYEKDGKRYYVYKEIDPSLYQKQLFYVTEDNEYNEIALKSNLEEFKKEIVNLVTNLINNKKNS